MKNQALGILVAGASLIAAFPAAAQQGACINDSNGAHGRVCAQISAQPENVVQASKLDGVRDTFVNYTAVVTNIANPTSTRITQATFTLVPAVEIVSVSSAADACSVSGSVVTCTYDKRTGPIDDEVTFTAKAPEYAGSSTPSTLIATGEFGWQGNTETVTKAHSVSTKGGYTWVPPNTTVALVTAPENPNPALQTDANNPLWAKMVLPGRSVGYVASLDLNLNTDENLALSCSAGLYHSGNSDGGPYICRDIGAPFDAGVGTRWIEAIVDSDVDGSFTDTPVQVTLIWDDSIVSPAQLAAEAPPVAVFYHAQEEAGAVDTHPLRAFANTCDAAAPPCLTNVQYYSTNDLTATVNFSRVYDSSEADPLLPVSLPLLSMLSDVFDALVEPATAVGIPPPVIMK